MRRGHWRPRHREQELLRRGEIDIAVAVVKREISSEICLGTRSELAASWDGANYHR